MMPLLILGCLKEAEGEGVTTEDTPTPQINLPEVKYAYLAEIGPREAVACPQLAMPVTAPAIEITLLIQNMEAILTHREVHKQMVRSALDVVVLHFLNVRHPWLHQ